jgi:hypothetical protein
MDDMPIPPISLPKPSPGTGIKLKPPDAPPFQPVRLPPAPLPSSHCSGGSLGAISPHKKDRTNFLLGHFTINQRKASSSKPLGISRSGGAEIFEEEGVDEDEALWYMEYLEYIQSGAIGFFKLHGDVDGKRKIGKVRMDLYNGTYMYSFSSCNTEQIVPLILFQNGERNGNRVLLPRRQYT